MIPGQIRALPAGIANVVEPLPPDSGRGHHRHVAGSYTFTSGGPCSGLDLSVPMFAPCLPGCPCRHTRSDLGFYGSRERSRLSQAQDVGQFRGNATFLPTFFIAGVYWVTPGGAAPDHTAWVQVAVLQSATKVKDGPFSTMGQLQMAFSG